VQPSEGDVKKSGTVAIVGFGRFGKVMHRLFLDGFHIVVSSSSYRPGDIAGVTFVGLEEACRIADAILLTVPINKTGLTGERIRSFLRPGQIVVDVCSVKEWPYGALKVALEGTGVTIWPTHPMFGPDSSKQGFQGLNWVSCEEDLDPKVIAPYRDYLSQRGLNIIQVSCEEHDRLAARTQGLTHFIGRFLDALQIEPTEIDTLGYKRLIAVKEQTCHDTWELFCDLQQYNRFSLETQKALSDAIFKVTSRFLDTTTKRAETRVGIVAGTGIDAEKAAGLLKRVGEENAPGLATANVQMNTVATPQELLAALDRGALDYGLLKLSCAETGPLLDTLQAMGRHHFKPLQLLHYEEETDTGLQAATAALVRRRKWE
jgi:prephenate dehydrogenase